MNHNAGSVEARNKQIVQAAFDKWAAGTGNLFDDPAPDAKGRACYAFQSLRNSATVAGA
jgi:hypothetical protein